MVALSMYFFVTWVQVTFTQSLLKPFYLPGNDDFGSHLAQLIESLGNLPKENQLTEVSSKLQSGKDVTYVLSKLSDKELIRLLNSQPKRSEYNLKDIVSIALNKKNSQSDRKLHPVAKKQKSRFNVENNKVVSQEAYFKLENKQVNPYSASSPTDPSYVALQKINKILQSHSNRLKYDDLYDNDDEKKQLLFDTLVEQLKTLCCKSRKVTKQPEKLFRPNVNSPSSLQEQMFLIVNDEVNNNDASDDLVMVDPESLNKNSSVLLLGPLASLSDQELKSVMKSLSGELSKLEYLPLLQKLSNGSLPSENVALMKNLVTGPATRRYIKPHRCNHQSQMSRIYGGPKWLLCTGYININTPSLYD